MSAVLDAAAVELRAVRLTLALSRVPQEVLDTALAERSYPPSDRQAEYPGDRFFEFVPALQEADIQLPTQ